jgi:phage repressor protein C with HTH and peptisase S24 domain
MEKKANEVIVATRRARLAELIATHYKSQADFVAQSGQSQSEVSGMVGGTKSFGEKKARTIEMQCGLEPGWLDRHEGQAQVNLPGAMSVEAHDPDSEIFVPIPMVELRLSAGVTGFQTEPDRREGGTIGMRRSWIERTGLHAQKLIAVKVRGESMEPSLYEDDIVIINTADTRPIDGAVFAVNYEGEAVVKRFSRDAGEWWLTSDSPDQRKHHRKVCRGEACLVIGRVVRKESDRI